MSEGHLHQRVSSPAQTALHLHNIANMIWSLGLFGLLFISIAEAEELNNFPENFVLGDNNSKHIKLICNTTADKDIRWTFNTLNVSFERIFELDHQTLMYGKYTCWSGGQELSSVYLLEEDQGLDPVFHCWAKSYDCNFSCTWKSNNYTSVRLGLGKDCAAGQKSCQWVSHSGPMPAGGFQFDFSHSLSPFTEENTMLEVTAEALIDLFFVRKTKKFFLRDIIRPDSPQIVKCESMGQNLMVSIEPPVNWSTPHSFFSLEHQIEYVLQDDGQSKYSSSPLIPNAISRLRVRSRDSLVQSAWSQWSDWKNGTC